MRRIATLALFMPSLVMAQPDQAGRTPPSTWKEDGYQQLKFGMGPKDIKDALRKPGNSLSTSRPLRLLNGAYQVEGHSVQIASVRVSIILFFSKRGLYRVWIRGPEYPHPDGEAIHSTAMLSLRQKYGRPTEDGRGVFDEWLRGDLTINLTGGPSSRIDTSITYSSRSLSEVPDQKLDQERKARLKKALDNY